MTSFLWLVLAATPAGRAERIWNFESGAAGLRADAGRIVAEPGRPANHAFRIAAARPHHTRLMVVAAPPKNFILSCRVKVLDWTGAPPTI